jgi:hypothetical protein
MAPSRNSSGTWPAAAHTISRGQRDEHRAELHQREVGDRHFQAVDEQDRHPVALAHAAGGGGDGQAVGEPVELPVSERSPGIARGHAAGMPVGLIFDQPRDRAEPAVVHRPPGEARRSC